MPVKKFLFLLFLCAATAFPAVAYEVPALTGPVIDEVGLLSASTRRQLEDSLYRLKQTQNVQLQVYIAKSLNDEPIENVTIQLFDKWKLGDEKTDKGLLFLIAPNEKRMRIEVGQGLEGDVPDVIAKRIISDVVRPHFQNGEFAIGIVQGVATLQHYIGNDDPALKDSVQKAREGEKGSGKGGKSSPWVILILIGLWIIIFLFNPSLALYILFSVLSGGRGGGGSGGGGWSGGGGRSSGGGASGGW